jgi:peptidoglycan/xylan/chitin deacetylase (PgdA/CDA1 family)
VTDYPRDLRGYGANPPSADWPGDARIAVQFVINFEEGGENCVLHGDSASEAFLSEIIGAAPVEGQRHMNMESLYEYGSRAGFWRLHRLFTRDHIPVTVFGVAMALERNPEAVAAMRESGWEVATHGYRWIDYQHVDEDTERAHLQKALEIRASPDRDPRAGTWVAAVRTRIGWLPKPAASCGTPTRMPTMCPIGTVGLASLS